ncbi:hypothetical protein ACFW9X_38545, partial [Streptomyces sp. NPDC059466]
MSQQGESRTGHEDDWWGQLYDDSTQDTGAAAAPDSLDDRFASAAGTVGAGTGGAGTGGEGTGGPGEGAAGSGGVGAGARPPAPP